MYNTATMTCYSDKTKWSITQNNDCVLLVSHVIMIRLVKYNTLTFDNLLIHVEMLQTSLNLAPSYSDQYSAIFNICLWFMIIFAITLLFIAWSIWFMDPGRDSIIYRMTSTRLKRE